MKFLALAAIAIVAAQDEETTEEAAVECAETECPVTGDDGTTVCTAQEEVDASEGTIVCDAEETAGDAEAEAEGSSTLFASVAAVAVAATMMY